MPGRTCDQANLPCVLQVKLAQQSGVRTVRMGPVKARGMPNTRATSNPSLPPPLYPERGRGGAANAFHAWGRAQNPALMTVKANPPYAFAPRNHDHGSESL